MFGLILACGVILLAGVSLDIAIALRRALRLNVSLGVRAAALQARAPFGPLPVALVLAVTYIPALLQIFAPDADFSRVTASQLVIGPAVYAVCAFGAIAVSVVYGSFDVRKVFGLDVCPAPKALGLGALYGLAALPPVFLLALVMEYVSSACGFEAPPQEVFELFGDPSLPVAAKAFLIGSTVLLAPVYEEGLFRGILFPAVLRPGQRFSAALLLCGLAFAFIHLHPVFLLPLLLLSVFLCLGYLSTGSLLTPVAMHAVFNAVNLLFWCTQS